MKNNVFILLLGIFMPVFLGNAAVLNQQNQQYAPTKQVFQTKKSYPKRPVQQASAVSEDETKAKKAFNSMLIGTGTAVLAVAISGIFLTVLVLAALFFLIRALVLARKNKHKKARITRIIVWSIFAAAVIFYLLLLAFGLNFA